MKNNNFLILSITGDKNYLGLKTGWTNKAGLTFIGLNQSNNREILTIVNKSTVNDNKDNHFSDTEILYRLSIDTFVNNVLLDNNEDIYLIRNSIKTSYIKTNESWIVFGNKYKKNDIKLNKINTNRWNQYIGSNWNLAMHVYAQARRCKWNTKWIYAKFIGIIYGHTTS